MNKTPIVAGQYSIPAALRRMENMHIVFWLFKDTSWCLNFKPLAILMIIPTLLIGIYITNKNKKFASELAHNLAVIFWITANSTWMICEFTGLDEKIVYGNITGRYLAIIPFVIGILILAYYYLFQQKHHEADDQPNIMTNA
jgi:hypothetical protein